MHNTYFKEVFKIVRLDKYNLSDLDKLHNAVHGDNLSYNYYQQKYNTSFTKILYIGFIAYNQNNLPVAYYGVIPCFIQYKNEIVLAAQSVDTMTHPDYRNNGLFVELCNRCINLCREKNIKLIFGFPNQNSYHGFINKLNWITIETMDCFLIRVKTFPFEKFCAKFLVSNFFYKKYTAFVLSKYVLKNEAGLTNELFKENYGGVLRDITYLNYKKYNQAFVLKIGKSKVWIKVSRHLTIGDMKIEENNFDEIIQTLKSVTAKLGLCKIYFHATKDTSLHNLFAEHYTANPSFPIIFKDLGSGLPLEKIKFSFADIDIF